jgi:hypothetical protein
MKSVALVLVLLVCAGHAASEPAADRKGIFSCDEWSSGREAEAPYSPAPQGQDTIYYDDGYGFWYSTVGYEWGVRFTADLPCTLHSALTMTFGFGEQCSLYVREDSAGLPGPVVLDTTYIGGAYPAWDRIDLSQPYFDMNSFWLTGRFPGPPYVVADSANNGARSFYSFGGQTWVSYSAGDLMIRAVVAYGDTLPHDMSVVNVTGIPTGVTASTEYSDTLHLANLGTSVESCFVEFEVRDTAGVTQFDTLLEVDSLLPRALGQLTSTWTPLGYGETYTISAAALLPGDLNPGNDTFTMTVYSYMDGEMYYDDFTSEVWLNVDMDDNDKFAVMYQPSPTPCYITGARFFADDTVSFGSLSLCPDAGGVPDTSSPYVQLFDVGTQKPGSWAWSSFDTSLTRVDADTVWLVLTWPNSSGGPHVGSDADYPVDGQSWAFTDSTGWVNWTESDFMMRIVSLPATGVFEEKRTDSRADFQLRALPNPFVGTTTLLLQTGFSLGAAREEDPSLFAFDMAGRCVKEFSPLELEVLLGGSGLSWDGRGTDGERLPPAVYFLVLHSGDSRATMKAVLLR